jgi:hypothetical protein
MRVALITLAAWLALAASAAAQAQVPSPIPATTRIAFDHDGQNTDRYLLVVDGTAGDLGKLTPASGTTYEIAFPALTPGAHTLAVCAENIAGRACSPPFPVSVIVQPQTPSNLRIVTR